MSFFDLLTQLKSADGSSTLADMLESQIQDLYAQLEVQNHGLYDELAVLRTHLAMDAKVSEDIPQPWVDVLDERVRQQEVEEHTPQDDVRFNHGGQLTAAAICYLAYPNHATAPHYWPWRKETWNPKADRYRQLKIAAALILAEMERMKNSDRLPHEVRGSYECYGKKSPCTYSFRSTDPKCTGCPQRIE